MVAKLHIKMKLKEQMVLKKHWKQTLKDWEQKQESDKLLDYANHTIAAISRCQNNLLDIYKRLKDEI